MSLDDSNNVIYVEHNHQASPQSQHEKTLGISMIVKDEKHIILKCLESMAPYIDYWVVNDTGSTDGTPDLILDFFRNKYQIPGELHHVPWKNFSYNRNIALQAAKTKTDYTLLVDADFILNVHDPDFKLKLSSPAYLIQYDGGLDYRQVLLIEGKHNWEYRGVTHEFIDTYPEKLPSEITDMISIDHTFEGSSRAVKFDRDAQLLEQGIKDEPDNARYYFYLGQSYKDLRRYDQAIMAYTKRTTMTEYDEEVFYSWYQIGMCKKKRGDSFYQYVGDLMKAYLERRHRLEPLYQILDSCCQDLELAEYGFQVGKLGEKLSYPTYDLLFIEKPIYEWMFLDLWATCAEKAYHYQEALEITARILDEERCPIPQEVKRFTTNLTYLDALKLAHIPTLKSEPFEFIRLKPEAKAPRDHRIASIILNYNMPERTTRIVNFFRNQGQITPMDLILVDNGSDKQSPSNFTTIFLTKHLDQTPAFQMGINYAQELERAEDFQYWGYLLISNHAEIPLQITAGSLVDGLRKVLLEHPRARGVQPALTMDSSVDLPHLIYPFVKEVDPDKIHHPPRLTNLLGHDFVLYRASWLLQEVGGLPPELPTGLGINLALSYQARSNGHQLYLLPSFLVRVITNLHTRIKRSDESAQGLAERGFRNFCRFAKDKYGENYLQTLQEAEITNDDRAPGWYNQKQVDQLIHTMLHFEKAEGGHKLLMDYIYHHHQGGYPIKRRGQPIRLLEIGATNQPYPHMDSTGKLELLCRVYGYQFISVDQDQEITSQNLIRTEQLNNQSPNFHLNGFRVRHITQDATKYVTGLLEQPQQQPDQIHYVYLDPINVTASNNSDQSIQDLLQINLPLLKLLNRLIPKGGLICLAHTNPEIHKHLTTNNQYTLISKNPLNQASLYIKK